MMEEKWEKEAKKLRGENSPEGEGWTFITNCTDGERTLKDYLKKETTKGRNEKRDGEYGEDGYELGIGKKAFDGFNVEQPEWISIYIRIFDRAQEVN